MNYRNAAAGAALGAAIVLLTGTAAMAQITILESPTAPVPGTPGNGLIGDYYGEVGLTDGAAVQDDSGAQAYLSSHAPVATFISTLVAYQLNGSVGASANDGESLDTYLGADSLTLSDPSVGNNELTGQIIQFNGFLAVTTPGTYLYGLDSDDGSYLDFGGQLAIDDGNDHGPATVTQELVFSSPGLYSMSLTYYENGGGTTITFLGPNTIGSAVPTSQLYHFATSAAPEPGSAPLLLGTLSMAAPMGLLRLRRRRSAA
jgi:hypothetical protein